VRTGIVPAAVAPDVVATFTGGFKRSHGAFRYGELALRNHGSHYGFVESGVIFSKLQPGLATVFTTTDGRVTMKTWDRSDDELLSRIVHARQNGVPVLERSPDGGTGVPGSLVGHFGSGNWSGSASGSYRTLRAGLCSIETPERHFLVYGYFSGATPSAMARVFQGYGCAYGMLTDMNALEHTYMATYRREGQAIAVSHLIRGMDVLDQEKDGRTLPRFLAFSDNRDFFYLRRREEAR